MRVSKIATGAAIAMALAVAGLAIAQSGPGLGAGTGGMMGRGMMGPGMMGRGMMGPGMMMHNGTWCAGCGYMGPGWGARQSSLNLGAADVKAYMESYLQYQANPRVKLDAVKETDADSITADVVTTEGGVLVQRYIFDRRTGAYRPG
ncbi:hypothetical protein ASD21_05095 [Caulobacter sp. Root1455]|uniref:hypothetical protein n=1 Tax=Caulobacter sp. Root1455 TaxID=1736465 RepID=UPI0006F85E15|nr:hypothetical protein [Caulobacter sp. Root1455]KQY95886.1 hypothetical protein ASD21_05095 [Caulobacter sp. Root1455]